MTVSAEIASFLRGFILNGSPSILFDPAFVRSSCSAVTFRELDPDSELSLAIDWVLQHRRRYRTPALFVSALVLRIKELSSDRSQTTLRTKLTKLDGLVLSELQKRSIEPDSFTLRQLSERVTAVYYYLNLREAQII